MGLLIRQLFDFISRSTVQPLRREAMELPRMLNDNDAIIRDQIHTIVRFNRRRFFRSDPVKQSRKRSASEQDTLNTRAIRKGIAFY